MSRRRIAKIALFPIIAPLFLAGYMLSHIGKPKAKTTQKQTAKPTCKHDATTENYLEIGLMQQLTEEPITTN